MHDERRADVGVSRQTQQINSGSSLITVSRHLNVCVWTREQGYTCQGWIPWLRLPAIERQDERMLVSVASKEGSVQRQRLVQQT